MLKEFKEFAMKGNVLDMAIGIIIGAAFGKIITSLVGDVIMPPIGLVLGRVDFSSLFLNLSHTHYDSLAAAKAAGVVTINYGLFLNTVIDFSDRGDCNLPCDTPSESLEKTRSGCGAGDQGLSVLFFCNLDESHALP